MSSQAVETRVKKLGASVVKALEGRNFEAYYCDTKEEAAELALSLIPEGSSISWGGSVSVDETGIKDKLQAGNYTLLDRDTVDTPEEKTEMMRRGLTCDVFLTGTNALSEDGQLVNIDGTGNRVASMSFGPRSVIVLAGVNKIVQTVEDAYARARGTAAPINAQRFPGMKTPCAVNGTCGNCKSPDCICSYIVTTRMCRPAKRIKVIVVGESLGF